MDNSSMDVGAPPPPRERHGETCKDFLHTSRSSQHAHKNTANDRAKLRTPRMSMVRHLESLLGDHFGGPRIYRNPTR